MSIDRFVDFRLHNTIMDIFYNENICSSNKNELSLLESFEMLDSSGKLTEMGMEYAINSAPLEKQCECLSIEMFDKVLDYDKGVEKSLLSEFSSMGYIGDRHEGLGVSIALRALALDALKIIIEKPEKYDSVNFFKHANIDKNGLIKKLYTGYLFIFARDFSHGNDLVASHIASCDHKKYLSNYQEILASNHFKEEYKTAELSIDFAALLYSVITKSTFQKMWRMMTEGCPSILGGWPDITMIKDGKIQLIEVKTTDKLRISQISKIRIIKDNYLFNVSVWRVSKPSMTIKKYGNGRVREKIKAYDNKDYESLHNQAYFSKTYRAILKNAADIGNDIAQYFMGALYLLWDKDNINALKYFYMSAYQGNKESQYQIAESYLEGWNHEKNISKAEQWFKISGYESIKLKLYSMKLLDF